MATPTWIDEELKTIASGSLDIERLPTVKFESGKVTEIVIDSSKPFPTWTGKSKGSDKEVTKYIIPCTVKGEKMNFWCNKKNPLARELMTRMKEGKTTFRIIQTGNQAETRYTIIEG